MNLTEINIREKKFHDNLQSKKSGRFENIFYKAIYNLNEDFFEYIEKHCKDKSLLDIIFLPSGHLIPISGSFQAMPYSSSEK